MVRPLLLLLLMPLLEGRSECVRVEGYLRCSLRPSAVHGVRVEVVDEDPLPFEIDDLMGRTWTNEQGFFSGCGFDFGEGNFPDPYLRVFHNCTHSGKETLLETYLVPLFLPRIILVGGIELHDSDSSTDE